MVWSCFGLVQMTHTKFLNHRIYVLSLWLIFKKIVWHWTLSTCLARIWHREEVSNQKCAKNLSRKSLRSILIKLNSVPVLPLILSEEKVFQREPAHAASETTNTFHSQLTKMKVWEAENRKKNTTHLLLCSKDHCWAQSPACSAQETSKSKRLNLHVCSTKK